VLIPKTLSDLKGTAVPSLVCPWEWERVLEKKPSKATDNPRTTREGSNPNGKLEKLCRSDHWETHLPSCANQEEKHHRGSALLRSGESAQFQRTVLTPALGSFLRITPCSSRF